MNQIAQSIARCIAAPVAQSIGGPVVVATVPATAFKFSDGDPIQFSDGAYVESST